MKKKIVIIIAFIVVAGLIYMWFSSSGSNEIQYRTVRVQKGDITVTVTATGTLNAIKTVEVGTQISGVIDKIFIDFNSEVRKGQVIAVLDTTNLAANLRDARANLMRLEAQYLYDQKEYDRNKLLLEKEVIANSDFDLVEKNYRISKANYLSAKAQVEKAITNLGYATIKAPIDGIVVNRNVNEGQTVAASFNTPTLFIIAKDLTQMQVEASVDEADIGQVKEGQEVVFSVDAFPEEEFVGRVKQVRMQPVVEQNVVTYIVVIDAPNPKKKLKPGMTANVRITVDQRNNVLKVPEQALRFKPSQEMMEDIMKRNGRDSGQLPGTRLRENRQGASAPEARKKPNETIRVWMKKGDSIVPTRVKKGLSDGTYSELIEGDLQDGTELIVGIDVKRVKNSSQISPFLPTRRRR